MVQIKRVGNIKQLWGESPRWDDRRGRLYFVDSGAQRVCWIDEGQSEQSRLKMPSMPTAVVLTESKRVLVVLDDGLHLVDPDSGDMEKFADNPAPPPEPRLNDAQADRTGNLITGSLGFEHNPVGSFWRLSKEGAWTRFGGGVSDANGPIVSEDGHTLMIVDTGTPAVYAYPYDGKRGVVGDKRIMADTIGTPGIHDGATLDTNGNYWSAMTGGGSCLVCVSPDGEIKQQLDLPVDYPTAVTFGGAERNRMYVTSVSIEFGPTKPKAELAGALLEITGHGAIGAPEPRFGVE